MKIRNKICVKFQISSDLPQLIPLTHLLLRRSHFIVVFFSIGIFFRINQMFPFIQLQLNLAFSSRLTLFQFSSFIPHHVELNFYTKAENWENLCAFNKRYEVFWFSIFFTMHQMRNSSADSQLWHLSLLTIHNQVKKYKKKIDGRTLTLTYGESGNLVEQSKNLFLTYMVRDARDISVNIMKDGNGNVRKDYLWTFPTFHLIWLL